MRAKCSSEKADTAAMAAVSHGIPGTRTFVLQHLLNIQYRPYRGTFKLQNFPYSPQVASTVSPVSRHSELVPTVKPTGVPSLCSGDERVKRTGNDLSAVTPTG